MSFDHCSVQFKAIGIYFGGMFLAFIIASLSFNYVDWLVPITINERASEVKREAVRDKKFLIEKNNHVVVVIGDSRVTCGFIPNVFDTATNHLTTSINLALPSHGIERYYYQLREFVESYGAPDFLLIAIRTTPGIKGKHSLGAKALELIDYAYTDSVSRRYLTENIFPVAFRAHHLNIIFNQHQFSEMLKKRIVDADIIEKMLAERGVFWWVDRFQVLSKDYKDANDNSVSNPESFIDPILLPRLKKLLDYSKDNGIRVLLITTPNRIGSVGQFDRRPLYINDILLKYSNVRMADDGWKVKYYDNSMFLDNGHVNYYGADMFTKQIAIEFLNEYKL